MYWYYEEEVYYGWNDNQNHMIDEPIALVKSPEPGVWAGWVYTSLPDNYDRECVTDDFDSPKDAMLSVESILSTERKNA